MEPDYRHQPPRRFPVHEARDPADPQAGRRRDHQYVLGRRNRRHQGQSRVHRRETWRDRTDQGSGPRLRRAEHPRQRRLSRLHRHPDDGSLHRRHGRRARQGDRGGAGRTDGHARGDRCGRPLAVLGRGCLRRWARYGHRRGPNGAVTLRAVAFATFTTNGNDSYCHSGGTRRQTRGLDGKGQRPTIPGQIQDRVKGNQLIFQIGASIYV